MALIGEITQMASHRVLRSLEFRRECRRQHAPVRPQPLQNQLFALLGQQPVDGFLSRSLHVFTLLGL
jgi:hypothetical protein